MALILQSEQDSTGVIGEYWRITQLNINFDRKDAVVTLQLYINKDARDAGKNPLNESIQLPLEGDLLNKLLDGEAITTVIRKQAYEVFKAKAAVEAAKPESEDEDQGKNMKLAAFTSAVDDK